MTDIGLLFPAAQNRRARLLPRVSADAALRAAVAFWFVVTIAGQLIFAFAVAAFYGMTGLRGDYHRWSFSRGGHIAGDPAGNAAVIAHLACAVVITVLGAIQLIPGIRARFPRLHRYLGRIYMLSAVGVSGAGLYITWVRGSVGDLPAHIGSTLNAILIWVCAVLAIRFAIARDFARHRRWALRLFFVVSASWFVRIGLFLTLAIAGGPIGFDPTTFTGPLLTFMMFAQYLVPLAFLELYFLARARQNSALRAVTAVVIVILTLATGAGIGLLTVTAWGRQIRMAFDTRTPIAETLAATIERRGIDEAVRQYQTLHAANSASINFEEAELRSLGYRLIRERRFADAVRIMQLNTEAYPKSSRTWDSLGDAYRESGDTTRAVASYRAAVRINPKNVEAAIWLRKLRG